MQLFEIVFGFDSLDAHPREFVFGEYCGCTEQGARVSRHGVRNYHLCRYIVRAINFDFSDISATRQRAFVAQGGRLVPVNKIT